MTPVLKLSTSLLLLLALTCSSITARAASYSSMQIATGETATTTTETSPGSLEDPTNSATTSDGGELSDDICYRCYDKIKAAEDLIAIQSNLVAKQKKLIHRKNKAAAEAAAKAALNPFRSSSSSSNTTANTSNQNTQDIQTSPTGKLNSRTINRKPNNNSTVRNRTLQYQSEPIVISRLRVARSPSEQQQFSNKNKFGRNKKDPDLKQLKQEQEHQLNETCRSLSAVQECLSELSRTCIGDLQFHSLEVWSNQWHSKLNCPYRNNPNLRVFPGLATKNWYSNDEREKSPIARPVSSDEEVRKRLDKMFPNGAMRPPGVMLKPTLTGLATQQFKSMGLQQQLNREQIEQQHQPVKSYHNYQSRNNYLDRQQQQQQPYFEDEVNLVNVGKILLVPCCFITMVAFVTLARLYFKRPVEKI